MVRKVSDKRKKELLKKIPQIKQGFGTQPPKEWWEAMSKIVRQGYPGRSKQSESRIVAGIWHSYSPHAKMGIVRRLASGTGGIPRSTNPLTPDETDEVLNRARTSLRGVEASDQEDDSYRMYYRGEAHAYKDVYNDFGVEQNPNETDEVYKILGLMANALHPPWTSKKSLVIKIKESNIRRVEALALFELLPDEMRKGFISRYPNIFRLMMTDASEWLSIKKCYAGAHYEVSIYYQDYHIEFEQNPLTCEKRAGAGVEQKPYKLTKKDYDDLEELLARALKETLRGPYGREQNPTRAGAQYIECSKCGITMQVSKRMKLSGIPILCNTCKLFVLPEQNPRQWGTLETCDKCKKLNVPVFVVSYIGGGGYQLYCKECYDSTFRTEQNPQSYQDIVDQIKGIMKRALHPPAMLSIPISRRNYFKKRNEEANIFRDQALEVFETLTYEEQHKFKITYVNTYILMLNDANGWDEEAYRLAHDEVEYFGPKTEQNPMIDVPEVMVMVERHGIPIGTRGLLLHYEAEYAFVRFPQYYNRTFKYSAREISAV